MVLNKTYTMIALIAICMCLTLYIKQQEEQEKKGTEKFSTQSTQLFKR